jgi:large subunit ribosomal protein L18
MKTKRKIRHLRIRKKIKGTKDRPRLFVFKSLKHIYAQLINDENGETILSASDFELKKPKAKGQKSKVEIAKEVGKLIAKKAKELKIEKVVFDRGGYKYHGKVKALAEGAREGGLKF